VVESDARYEVQAVAHARHVANVWEFHSSRLALARALSTGRVSGLPLGRKNVRRWSEWNKWNRWNISSNGLGAVTGEWRARIRGREG
jgi:hypothetical protein